MNYDLLIILFSYLCGSIPFGLIISYIFKKNDPRSLGSKNIGATNVLRTGGFQLGLLTLVLDILKGFIAVKTTLMLNIDLVGLSMIFVVIGHIFPIWLKFKGGKGVATYVGILFCINIYLVIVFIVSWLVIFTLTKYSSLASMLSSLFVPLTSYFLLGDNNYYFYIIFGLLILITHRENIKRLKNNTESKTKIY